MHNPLEHYLSILLKQLYFNRPVKAYNMVATILILIRPEANSSASAIHKPLKQTLWRLTDTDWYPARLIGLNQQMVMGRRLYCTSSGECHVTSVTPHDDYISLAETERKSDHFLLALGKQLFNPNLKELPWCYRKCIWPDVSVSLTWRFQNKPCLSGVEMDKWVYTRLMGKLS